MLWWFTPVHFSQHVNLCWLPAARPMPACSFSCLFLHDITNPLRTFSCVCTCLRLGQQTTTRTAIVLALALQFFLPICVHLCRVCVRVCVVCTHVFMVHDCYQVNVSVCWHLSVPLCSSCRSLRSDQAGSCSPNHDLICLGKQAFAVRRWSCTGQDF